MLVNIYAKIWSFRVYSKHVTVKDHTTYVPELKRKQIITYIVILMSF